MRLVSVDLDPVEIATGSAVNFLHCYSFRIDEKNGCKIFIDVCSFSTIEDDRSMYCKGRRLEWWVDPEEYSIIEMEDDVSKHYNWASYQEPNFWYSDQNGQTMRLASDKELLTLLRASRQVKFIMTVDRCSSVGALNVTQNENDLVTDSKLQLVQVTDELNEQHIQVTDEVNESSAQATQEVPQYNGQEWAEVPELGLTAAGPARVEEEEKEHYMEPGVDPDGDEPIGADEEWRYFKKAKVAEGDKIAKVLQENKKVDKKGEKKGKGQEAFDSDAVPSDEASMANAAFVAHTTYDRDNPDIKKGSTFVDKNAFVLLMKQFAIKREFETFVVHSDKSRYRAKCVDPECEWKVHAKKLLGCPTFMVN